MTIVQARCFVRAKTRFCVAAYYDPLNVRRERVKANTYAVGETTCGLKGLPTDFTREVHGGFLQSENSADVVTRGVDLPTLTQILCFSISIVVSNNLLKKICYQKRRKTK